MPPFIVMDVLERAVALERQGRSIIHLEVGEPDFDSPAVVVEAGERALRAGRTHYTHSLGHLELRQAIAAWHRRRYGVETSPDRIVVTMGCSGAMLLAFAALLDPGDEVLLTDPCYACYPNFVTAFGGRPVRLPVCEADGFQFQPAAVAAAITPRTRAIVINSPANPTGTLLPPDRMQALVDVLSDPRLPEPRPAGSDPAATLPEPRFPEPRPVGSDPAATSGVTPNPRTAARPIVVISDEIYHGLVYGERAHSIREFAPDAVVINGFSKLFAMTGWRLGYAIVPEWLVRPMQKVQQNLFISAPDFAQFAAIAALEQADADVEHMRRCYDERRQVVLAGLREMGLKPLTEPTGAFYVFVNVRQYTDDVYRFAFRILEEAGVAVTPGVDFGPGGEGFIRISYANKLENIQEGLRRLAGFLRR